MTRQELARLLDHSVLRPEATEEDVVLGAELVRQWGIGYYCVPDEPRGSPPRTDLPSP